MYLYKIQFKNWYFYRDYETNMVDLYEKLESNSRYECNDCLFHVMTKNSMWNSVVGTK